jgi:hypothetical protein
MRSHGKGVKSATTQVKVLSPEIILVALGQGFQTLEACTGARVKGERVFSVPGSKSVAGKQTVYIGTWENRDVPFRSRQGAEEVTRRYDVPVVGPTHIRGVGGVMPVEGGSPLEGVGSLTQRGRVSHAVH